MTAAVAAAMSVVAFAVEVELATASPLAVVALDGVGEDVLLEPVEVTKGSPLEAAIDGKLAVGVAVANGDRLGEETPQLVAAAEVKSNDMLATEVAAMRADVEVEAAKVGCDDTSEAATN